MDILRLSGSTEKLQQAVRRLAGDGPAAAVALAAAGVHLERSTRTSGPADLALLEFGGDLLDAETADRNTRWLLSALNDPASFVNRTSPSYVVEYRLLNVLANIVAAASPDVQRLVAERIDAIPAQTDQLVAGSWGRLVRALPDGAWTKRQAEHALTRAVKHHDELRYPLLKMASPFNHDVRQTLLDDAKTGSLDALEALGDVRSLPRDVVRPLVASLSASVDRQVADAQLGEHAMGGQDAGHTLAVLNVCHPDLANWSPLVRLIEEPRVMGAHKCGALRVLTAAADRVANSVKGQLTIAARSAATQGRAPQGFFAEDQNVAGAALECAAALAEADDPMDPDQIPILIGGGAADRKSAAGIAAQFRHPEGIGILIALSNDPEPGVRASAAYALTGLMAESSGPSPALSAVHRCARDPGTQVPAAVAAALSALTSLTTDAASILAELRGHISAAVRSAARPQSAIGLS